MLKRVSGLRKPGRMTSMPDLWKRLFFPGGHNEGSTSGEKEVNWSLSYAQCKVQVAVRRPSSFAEAESIAGQIKAGQAVVVNLEGLPLPTARRLVDYLSGATYGLDGNMEKVGAFIFLFTPPGVNIHVRDLFTGLSTEE